MSVPLTEANIPNVFVSVLLVKGRTEGFSEKDSSDPGKPAFRLGYCELKVEDTSKRLDVHVSTDKEEYRPAAKAKIEVAVKDAEGKPDQAEVTLWAVDYGVLSLTAYKTPSLLESVWVEKALQVMNEDSRQRIISRRVITPKGADEGGGGGMESGPGTPVRKDFRVLAFWLGSLPTDAKGLASTEVTLPESLTTYRVMAVVHDKASRFGWGQREFRISKPVLLRAAFPRFLALGDKAFFGSVVNSQLKEKGTAIVTMKSLDPGVLEVTGDGKQTVEVDAKGASEVRFNVETKAVGTARLQMSVKLLNEEDAFEDVIPVRILVSPEVVAAYGQAQPEAKEALEIPAGVVPSFGGLRLELSSTAMVGLGEGARYLVDYPYGCAEQRASCALALLLAADLGDAFSLPGIERRQAQADRAEDAQGAGGLPVPQRRLRLLEGRSLPLRVGLPDVLRPSRHAKRREARVHRESRRAGQGLRLPRERPRRQEARQRRLVARLHRLAGLRGQGPRGGRAQRGQPPHAPVRLRRPDARLRPLPTSTTPWRPPGRRAKRPKDLTAASTTPSSPKAAASHVEELDDPYLMWFWNSNARSTAIVLGSLVRDSDDAALVPGMVRWLMQVRKKGRWGNTQENALAMESLVDYYRKYEKEVPDFTAVVTLGASTLAKDTFKGRSTEATKSKRCPCRNSFRRARPARSSTSRSRRRGPARSSTWRASSTRRTRLFQSGLDMGFRMDRAYAVSKESGDSSPADVLQGRRPCQGHSDVPPDQGAALRGRDGPDPGGLRAGRVLVRHDRHGPRAPAGAGGEPAGEVRGGRGEPGLDRLEARRDRRHGHEAPLLGQVERQSDLGQDRRP